MTSSDSRSAATRAPVEYGSEAFVEMLNANDVECLFINSGTDTFPIQEAIAKYMELGRRTPRVILCPDEGTAIAAAHGYFDVTRKPQVVLVHVDKSQGASSSVSCFAPRPRLSPVRPARATTDGATWAAKYTMKSQLALCTAGESQRFSWPVLPREPAESGRRYQAARSGAPHPSARARKRRCSPPPGPALSAFASHAPGA